MTNNEIIKECRQLAKSQNVVFRKSKTVGLIGGAACYEIESGIQCKVLAQGSLTNIWENLLNESCANQ